MTRRIGLWCGLLLLAVAVPVAAAARVESPKEFFGYNVADDYKLVNYTELVSYWNRLDKQSDRMQMREIGTTAEGRQMVMAVLSSPHNLRSVERYRENSKRLALAEGLDDAGAHRLAEQSKAIVWIDGGLHATEVVGAQNIIELVYEMCSRDDAEVRDILENVILLVCPVNPDGLELVANWYREHRNLRIPRLYQKYIGHDDNRDFYACTQPETIAINHVFYFDWFPQIIYNHHQSAPAGTIINTPPFRNPFNYNFDPLVVRSTDLVAAHINTRFEQENKPGVISRTQYSTWWNGGLRTTAYFHNMIGILTETAHADPAPGRISPRPEQLVPTMDYPHPITARPWHLRDSLEYCMTANYAVLDVAARCREQFLYNIYQMGRNAIRLGQEETPSAYVIPMAAAWSPASGFVPNLLDFSTVQPDEPTAAKFVNALIRCGIVVHRAKEPFTADGKTYPAGSFVVKLAQAFRPHIRDMFEPQRHPHDVEYPGGPPIPPYDSAGWTLAMQMAVHFDRVREAITAPLEKVEGEAKPAFDVALSRSLEVSRQEPAVGGLLRSEANDAFTAIQRVLAAGGKAYRLTQAAQIGGRSYPAGTFFVPEESERLFSVGKRRDLGLSVEDCFSKPDVPMIPLKTPRVGLFDVYGGSIPSGWTRWLFEQFEIPFQILWGAEIDRGNLISKYDVIVLPSGTAPAGGGRTRGGAGESAPGPAAGAALPKGYEERTRLTASSREQLRRFMQDGGTVVAVGTASNIGTQLGLPIRNVLTQPRAIPSREFYCPGSVLEVNVDTTQPLAWGMPARAFVFYNNSPAFEITDNSARLQRIAWYGDSNPLRSGWIHGEQHLFNRAAVVAAEIGKGKLFLLGPEATFRAQSHGTFKLLFNALYGAGGVKG
jgi:Zinc carboxypeptidase